MATVYKNADNSTFVNGLVTTPNQTGFSFSMQAWNGSSFTTFATMTSNSPATFNFDDSVTKANNYIYRAGGTDVAIADGGTGLSTTPTDGQLLIGKTSTNNYTLTTLTAGSGISITNGSGSISIAASGGFTWNDQTTTPLSAAVNNGYIMDAGASLITATLPATAALGSIISFVGKATGLYTIAQNSGQTIHYGNQNTTTGVAGSLTSTNQYDCIELICVTANTDFVVRSSVGNFTVA